MKRFLPLVLFSLFVLLPRPVEAEKRKTSKAVTPAKTETKAAPPPRSENMHFIFNILRGFEGEGQFAPPTAVAPAPRIFMIAVPQQALESVGVAQNAVMGLPMNCPGHITFIDGVSAEFDFVCPDRHLITGTIKRVEGKWRGSGNDSKGGPFEIEEVAPPPAR